MKKNILLAVLAVLVVFAGTKTVFAATETSADGNFVYEADYYAGTCKVTGYNGSLDKINIPKKIDDLKVTEVALLFPENKEAEKIENNFRYDLPDGSAGWSSANGDYMPTSVGEIVVPEGVTAFSAKVDSNNSAMILSVVKITLPSTLKSVYIKSLGLKELTIPGNVESMELNCLDTEKLIIESGVKKVENCYSMYSLKEVVLPKTVKEIGYQAFDGCYNLEKIDLSNVEKIETGAFENTLALKSVSLGDKLSSIGTLAFNWSGLTKITVPKNAVINGNAFSNCYYLESANIKSAKTEKLDSTFTGCVNLKNVTLEEGPKKLYATFRDCKALTALVVPSTVTEITYGTFSREARKMILAVLNPDCSLYYKKDSRGASHIEVDNSAVILGYKDSTAQDFAKNNGNKFIAFNTVTNLKAANKAKGKVNLTFKGVKGVKSYTVYRSTSAYGGFKKIGTSKATKFTDKSAKKGTTYYYKIAISYTDSTGVKLSGIMSNAASVKVTK